MFNVGDRVYSKKFGTGTVKSVFTGSITVSFEKSNEYLWGKNKFVFTESGKSVSPPCDFLGGVYKLVNRRAKVGEWVLMTENDYCFGGFDCGDVLEVISETSYAVRFRTKRNSSAENEPVKNTCQPFSLAIEDAYLVIEGYEGEQPKPVEKPKEKHRYTNKQIAEAKSLAKHLICKAYDEDKHVILSTLDGMTVASFFTFYGSKGMAKCSPNDEFNEWIGKMVAICKLMNHPMPKWVTEHDKV